MFEHTHNHKMAEFPKTHISVNTRTVCMPTALIYQASVTSLFPLSRRCRWFREIQNRLILSLPQWFPTCIIYYLTPAQGIKLWGVKPRHRWTPLLLCFIFPFKHANHQFTWRFPRFSSAALARVDAHILENCAVRPDGADSVGLILLTSDLFIKGWWPAALLNPSKWTHSVGQMFIFIVLLHTKHNER